MPPSETNLFELKDDLKNQSLYLDIEGRKAFVQYKKVKNCIKLLHSEVPEELRGQGFGKILAKETFEYIANNNLRMVIHCDFLEAYLEKYGQKYKQYIAE